MMDVKKLTLALREYNAAGNSLRRAHEELSRALPEGMILLHRKVGEVDGPGTLYWSWEGSSSGTLLNGVKGYGENEGRNVVIVEAPAPREEMLPRLKVEGGA